MNPKQIIGDWLRDQLRASGMTRRQVCEQLGAVGVSMKPERLQTLESTAYGPARTLPAYIDLIGLLHVYGADAQTSYPLIAACLGLAGRVGGPVRIYVSGGQPGEADAVVKQLPDMMRARGITASPVVVLHG